MKNIDCKELKQKGLQQLKKELEGKEVTLKVIQVEGDSASDLYVRNKKKAAELIGMNFEHILLPEDISEEDIIHLIETLNEDNKTHGIMVQLPLPQALNEEKIINTINPDKDVDGLTNQNLGRIMTKTEGLRPCTAEGVLNVIDECIGLDEIKGKEVVIIGRTTLVGLPLIHMLLNYNVTPTICHTKTKDLKWHTQKADILITAAGTKEYLIDSSMIKDGALVIDVSTTIGNNGKFHGDVNPEVKEKAGYLTPVPGGIGQLTVLELMKNTYRAYEIQKKKIPSKGKTYIR
ncbi:MAG: bifunctional 5,10-methylenetetrahydrofolate dehydrogenase/5,10-methenyltetrahydrofolate cyclohydrolase [Bacilli bacterium]|nr:bifunctional 5,10-methylenetetrahydrofolate dehydrogenase/5,10-methenyltetrahydrofolate cyclohydrolase [Bacilli bacterium]